jgi:hypothetical protein
MGVVAHMRINAKFWSLFTLSLLFCSCSSLASKWPTEDCGDFVDIPIAKVDAKIVAALQQHNGLIDAEYDVSKESCKDGYIIAFDAKGKYKNPGFHWLAVVNTNEKTVKIVGGL